MNILLAAILAVVAAAAPHPPAADGIVFTLTRADARDVSLAGTFNRWDPARHRLAGPDRDGRWTITLPLAPGRYEYQFVVNGAAWMPDPAAPSVDDGLGGRNSVLTVPAPDR